MKFASLQLALAVIVAVSREWALRTARAHEGPHPKRGTITTIMHTGIIADNQLEKLRLGVERFRLRFNTALIVTGCPGKAIVGIIRCHDLRDKRQSTSRIRCGRSSSARARFMWR